MKKFIVCLILLLGAGMAVAESNLDFSEVTSLEKAKALEKQAKLFKVLLFPAEFGGEDIPQNVVYVPAGIPEMKNQITGTLVRFFQDGLINQLNVAPEYKGNSFIPSKINLKAWHSEKEGGLNPTIEIW